MVVDDVGGHVLYPTRMPDGVHMSVVVFNTRIIVVRYDTAYSRSTTITFDIRINTRQHDCVLLTVSDDIYMLVETFEGGHNVYAVIDMSSCLCHTCNTSTWYHDGIMYSCNGPNMIDVYRDGFLRGDHEAFPRPEGDVQRFRLENGALVPLETLQVFEPGPIPDTALALVQVGQKTSLHYSNCYSRYSSAPVIEGIVDVLDKTLPIPFDIVSMVREYLSHCAKRGSETQEKRDRASQRHRPASVENWNKWVQDMRKQD